MNTEEKDDIALQVLLLLVKHDLKEGIGMHYSALARTAYAMADAMAVESAKRGMLFPIGVPFA